MRTILTLACVLAALTGPARSEEAKPLRIGVISDMSGPYSAMGGPGSLTAARMAADFGGKVLGRPVEIVSGDHQNKPDTGSALVRRWFDTEGVEAVADGGASAVGLAVQTLARDKKKIFLISGSTTSDLTGKDCSPYGFQWAPDTYSTSVAAARAVLNAGGKTWFFVTADYSFGYATERDATSEITASGGQVVGRVRHPISTSDFSSFILQAQASNADVVAFANAGDDLSNVIKQSDEFGLRAGKQKIVAFQLYFNVIDAIGLKAAQGLLSATPYYWDADEQTRAWTKRFMASSKLPPTATHAGTYSAVLHYLRAVQAAGTTDADVVAGKIRAMEVDDAFVHKAAIRGDGRVMIDLKLTRVKSPADSKYPFDYLDIVSTVPAAQAYRSVQSGECQLAKQGAREASK